MEEKSNKAGNFWLGFFLGGIVGAFVIFVLGTKEGKKLAEKIRENGEILEEDLEEKVAKLQKKGEDIVKQAKKVKEQVVKEIEEKKGATSDALVTKMDEAFTKIEDLQKKGTALTEEVHQRYFKKDGKPLNS
ncbi:hypothetical protein A3D05_00290 [Candidatus Gottesmanbacteria bacterium RIFCSPHIGHO2_02_FULL_40_24]|uniref:Gas vesicle protein n=1 Tax=Candidatus Gottesmanbacteria bacterium RIFCSPHIGHO2_01_FULL_40_15 TaxID=1798376 RepID=A0A1F5Z6K8_9BACT|nr:MAG: hypothetical protein A2777_01700 [Candidatus Gottesmanbacteria bacterium RIFCSPHIGHO2_01_FULL_40_15]OGG18187.1 MAG: hypothetical protein A3D05_00290 [Candidatus Gottesmanbacteria bacterium RIFCSPHIGHO2_02_FULL_40_24]OGG23471.1 MAG: hypothetical protein A3E42_00370 [Candidatus Gottesmanbacteria bacterium RIFCSPHIGHO2_12_FULL_40_13]OGG32528.1 MAG: hypothetical protein A3I80_05685 [Candidatus Gottesmanbacteria bacterium RIFCSPLOWO2_02_FULL_40_10]